MSECEFENASFFEIHVVAEDLVTFDATPCILVDLREKWLQVECLDIKNDTIAIVAKVYCESDSYYPPFHNTYYLIKPEDFINPADVISEEELEEVEIHNPELIDAIIKLIREKGERLPWREIYGRLGEMIRNTIDDEKKIEEIMEWIPDPKDEEKECIEV